MLVKIGCIWKDLKPDNNAILAQSQQGDMIKGRQEPVCGRFRVQASKGS
jgi:hypothetical protein